MPLQYKYNKLLKTQKETVPAGYYIHLYKHCTQIRWFSSDNARSINLLTYLHCITNETHIMLC